MILSWLLLFVCVIQNVFCDSPPMHEAPIFHPRMESALLENEDERQSFPPMINHGGPVIAAPVIYIIWYGSWSLVDKNITVNFASNLGRTAWWGINKAYGVGPITYRGSATDLYSKGKVLNTRDVFGVVQNAFNKSLLPKDPNAIYLVLSSSDVTQPGFCTQYCGWHNFNGNIKYGFIGVPPNQGCFGCFGQRKSPNNNAGVDAAVNVIAHELAEAATDPNLNAWFNTNGEENADVCNFRFLDRISQNGSFYNLVVGGQKYYIQSNFNLAKKTCTMA